MAEEDNPANEISKEREGKNLKTHLRLAIRIHGIWRRRVLRRNLHRIVPVVDLRRRVTHLATGEFLSNSIIGWTCRCVAHLLVNRFVVPPRFRRCLKSEFLSNSIARVGLTSTSVDGGF